MTPPISLSACPPEIRAHPLPGDQCTNPGNPIHRPESRFDRFSVLLEVAGAGIRSPVLGNFDASYRGGFYGLFRPLADLHLGLGIETDYHSELNLTARVGARIPLHPMRMYGINLTALAGLRQLFDQSHEIGSAALPVSGSLFSFGAEASMHFQVTSGFSVLLPYFRFMASPPSDVNLSAGGRTNIPWSWEMQFGLGLSFDFLKAGN